MQLEGSASPVNGWVHWVHPVTSFGPFATWHHCSFLFFAMMKHLENLTILFACLTHACVWRGHVCSPIDLSRNWRPCNCSVMKRKNKSQVCLSHQIWVVRKQILKMRNMTCSLIFVFAAWSHECCGFSVIFNNGHPQMFEQHWNELSKNKACLFEEKLGCAFNKINVVLPLCSILRERTTYINFWSLELPKNNNSIFSHHCHFGLWRSQAQGFALVAKTLAHSCWTWRHTFIVSFVMSLSLCVIAVSLHSERCGMLQNEHSLRLRKHQWFSHLFSRQIWRNNLSKQDQKKLRWRVHNEVSHHNMCWCSRLRTWDVRHAWGLPSPKWIGSLQQCESLYISVTSFSLFVPVHESSKINVVDLKDNKLKKFSSGKSIKIQAKESSSKSKQQIKSQCNHPQTLRGQCQLGQAKCSNTELQQLSPDLCSWPMWFHSLMMPFHVNWLSQQTVACCIVVMTDLELLLPCFQKQHKSKENSWKCNHWLDWHTTVWVPPASHLHQHFCGYHFSLHLKFWLAWPLLHCWKILGPCFYAFLVLQSKLP